MACAKTMSSHPVTDQDDVLSSDGDVSVALSGAVVEYGVHCQLKLRRSANECAANWFDLSDRARLV